ncbi:VCBS repeat-containing protein [bacterium]|nr:VCBS repeat-containing protein [bacterium]
MKGYWHNGCLILCICLFGNRSVLTGQHWTDEFGGRAPDSRVLAIEAINISCSENEVYAGGRFVAVDNPEGSLIVNHIAGWSSRTRQWSSLGDGIPGGIVYALAMHGDDLYAGGCFCLNLGDGNYANNIAKWDGTAWTNLGSGVDSIVYAMAFQGNDLYVGGDLFRAGELVSVQGIARWDGDEWHGLEMDCPTAPMNFSGVNGIVYSIGIDPLNDNPFVYVGGDFSRAGCLYADNIVKWDGSEWQTLGGGVDNSVYAISVDGNDVYAGGDFLHAENPEVLLISTTHIACWSEDDDHWHPLDDGLIGPVYAIEIDQDNVYAGGRFSEGMGPPYNNIAIWDGFNWSAMDDGVNGPVRALSMIPDGSLYAGGEFAEASDVASPYIAVWGDYKYIMDNSLEWLTDWAPSMNEKNGAGIQISMSSYPHPDYAPALKRKRIVIHFDIFQGGFNYGSDVVPEGGIAPGSIISNAKLKLYFKDWEWYPDNAEPDFRWYDVHPIKIPWKEYTSCWNSNNDEPDHVAWNGCDPAGDEWADSEPCASLHRIGFDSEWIGGVKVNYFEWAGEGLDMLVQRWINSPEENHGMLIKIRRDENNKNVDVRFHSSESTILDCALHPRLTFDLEPNPLSSSSSDSYGCSWGDYDNDGFMDLFVTNFQNRYEIDGMSAIFFEKNFLFHNHGDGTFRKVTDEANLSEIGGSRSACWAHLDEDAYLDLFVVNTNPANPLALPHGAGNCYYRNCGDGSFERQEDTPFGDSGTACCCGDFDQDGDLDLYITNVHNGGAAQNQLNKNNGDGTFTAVSSDNPDLGIISSDAGGNACTWIDYDNDDDLDLFVVNSDQSNFLYKNLGPDQDFRFQKIMLTTPGNIIYHEGIDCQGCSWGDYNNDGDPDLFITCYDGNNALYANLGNGLFRRILWPSCVVTDGGKSRGSCWGDYDNDGDLDLYVANDGNEKNFLYENDGDGDFTRIYPGDITNDEDQSNGCAWADCDRDGDLDLFVANRQGSDNKIYYNCHSTDNHWIGIHCEGNLFSNVSAIGARVYVTATLNDEEVTQMRIISSQSGLAGQNSLDVHFGLGNAVQVSKIAVKWPSSPLQEFEELDGDPIQADAYYTLIEGGEIQLLSSQMTEVQSNNNHAGEFELYQNFPNPFNPDTKIAYQLPEEADVTLKIYDMQGREIWRQFRKHQSAGHHRIVWNGLDRFGNRVASGVYVYRIELKTGAEKMRYINARKLILIK